MRKFYHLFEKFGSMVFRESAFRQRQLNIIRSIAVGVDSILEVGAGTNSYFHYENRPYRIIGFDIFEDSLKKAKEMGVLDHYIVGNVNKLNNHFDENSFDLVCAFDLIEHLTKEQGYKLLRNMEKIAKNRIVIYTPNGFQFQPPAPDNPYQEHLSGWSYEEMIGMGYTVLGINGYKKLRGMYSNPIARPYFFFNFISFVTEIALQKVNKDHLQYAILCYKNVHSN